MRNFIQKRKDFTQDNYSKTKSTDAPRILTDREVRILREDNGIKIKGSNVPLPFQQWNELSLIPKQV